MTNVECTQHSATVYFIQLLGITCAVQRRAKLQIVVDPPAPRVKIVGAGLLGDRLECPGWYVVRCLHRDSHNTNFAGVG